MHGYLRDGNLAGLLIVCFRAIPASQRISLQHLQATALESRWRLDFKAGGVSSTLVTRYKRGAMIGGGHGRCTVYRCLYSVMRIEPMMMVDYGLHSEYLVGAVMTFPIRTNVGKLVPL